ncbi:non-ribosomal peptide synthetase [Tenacibaculum agarivorans]|uniref:non-ribosomal peptide synthetase n=1 Tax=Tenacibaculum agarivorans TaxID=1908389 RepID=UPI000A6DEC85|nr:non-ribosomal peptide synthetase [Tenacibaculum agarivorans]
MYQTLIHIIKERRQLENKGIFFIDKGDDEEFISYKELYKNALFVLGGLRRQGVLPGNELVFQIKDNKTFLITFWACILGGIIPVPITVALKEEHKKKLFTIWGYLKTPYVISSQESLAKIETYAESNNLHQQFLVIKERTIDVSIVHEKNEKGEVYNAEPNDIAFIQFSSGSTGNPKGITLTHKNLITNIAAIAAAANYTEEDSMLSWMPLTHDMGMIGFHLNPIFKGMNQYLIPTNVFVRRPKIWLEQADKHRVTILCSPNFGYKYTIKNCLDVGNYNWDLSCVRLLYNGAEPISEALANEFMDKTAIYGLHRFVMRPVYGLAEASLAVTISDLLTPIISHSLSRDHLKVGDKIVVTSAAEKNIISFVNVGKVINDCEIEITNDDGDSLEEMHVGHIHIKGDNVTSGYYNNETATQNITFGEWLRTGDIGFVKEGCLYVIGRSKDIIFLNGQNYYPHDIELVAQELEAIELNKIVIGGKFNSKLQREETFAFVFHRGAIEKFIPIKQSLATHINHHFGFEIDHIIPVKDIPRTTSGKVQRYRMIQYYEEGYFQKAIEQLEQLSETLPKVQNYFSPQNKIEENLYLIWSNVLNKKSFGVTEKFFDLGGNSLKAAQVLSKIHRQFSVELDFDILYDKQTIRELAELLSKQKKTTYRNIENISHKEAYTVTPTQEQLYYIWEMDPSSIAYNIPIAFQLTEQLDVNQLEKSIQAIIARHEILRTVFIHENETVSQRILPELNISVTNKFVGESSIEKLLQEEVRSFNLNTGPLLRIALLHVTDTEYFLFVDMHHSIADGVSISLFLKEVFTYYQGGILPNLTVQYKDYVNWNSENKKTERLLSQKRYWTDLFSKEVPLLSLPTDFNRPSILSYEGAKLAFKLPAELSKKLRKKAEKSNSTLFTLMLGAYAVLLAKLTNEEETVIGVPVANRNHDQTQEMLGMFVNNLATRHRVNSDQTLNEFLQQTFHTIKEAVQHQEYSFRDLVDIVEEKRNFSRNSLFDTMFLYQNMELEVSDKFKVERFFFDPKFAKYDISVEVFDQEETIAYYIEYATVLFKESSIKRIGKLYQQILRKIIDEPQKKIAELSLLNSSEFKELIVDFNATESVYPKDKTLHQLIREQVVKTPHTIAVESEKGEQLTYADLDKKSEQLAYILREKGVSVEKPVAVIMDRSPELIISILAILKSNGCYLPIEKEYPQERIEYIIKDSQSKHVLINTKEEKESVFNLGYEIEVLDVTRKEYYGEEVDVIKENSTPNTLAYIIYTSGTTGNPKGVMVEHKAIVNYVCWGSKTYLNGREMDFPLYTSIAFDLTLTSIFVPLISGNTIYTYANTFALEDVVASNKVQIIKATPSHLKLMKSLLKDDESSIERIIVGGEDFTQELAVELYNLFKVNNVKIYNEYGPTEATIGCMIYEYNPNDERTRVPVGIPVANSQVYILDRDKNPLPKGSIGELYVSGDCLARGYLYRPELTEKKYIENPFNKGQRMYSTGDLAKRLDNGNIEYAGRIDQQIKINGHRIELEEIEKVLVQYQEVDKALVTVIENSDQVYLVAYVCIDENTNTLLDTLTVELKTFLRQKLPNYMLPRHIMTINTIPLTKNGKVDYEQLPKPKNTQKLEENTLPKTELEGIMLSAWENIFSQKNISINDNFIELGGDSIKAVQITSLLRKANVVLKVKDILNYQTITDILTNVAITRVKNEYEQGIVSGYLNLSPIQEWFFEKKLINPNFYNQSVLLEFYQPIDKQRVEKTLELLVSHHDGLRLNLDREQLKMYFNNDFLNEKITIETYTVETFANNRPLEKIFEEIKASFEIEKTLLIKGAIIKSKEKETLFLTAHHLVVDGISWRILLEDFKKVYEAEINKKEIELSKKTASLMTYTNEFTALVDQYTNEEEVFWSKQILNNTSIFQKHISNIEITPEVKTIQSVLDSEYTMFLLKDAHSIYNTTVEILLVTALVKTLYDWTGKEQIVLEMEHHGRNINDLDVSRTLGWFTSLYPLLFQIENEIIADQIKSVKDTIKSISDGGISYGVLKKFKKYKFNPEVRFNYLGQFGKEVNNELFSMTPFNLGLESDSRNNFGLKLEVNAMVFEDELTITMNYDNSMFSYDDMKVLSQNVINNLHKILTHIKEENTVHFTPSDFKMAGIDSTDLDVLF